MRHRTLPILLATAACLFVALIANAQSGILAPATVVKPQAYVSLQPVPRGKQFEIALVANIVAGYHVNSHKPTDPYLIPTTVTPELPKGFQLVDTIYPPGMEKRFPFSPDKPLNVYSGSVTLRLKLTAQNDAPLGPTTIPLTLRYQACNDAACLPPVKLPVTAKVDVAAANAKSRLRDPEIFRNSSAR
ncbi:MAG TPA: protein-disulfide reductase DsbD domain-containing protein [Candidatus Acidoferrum sp.]|nr:protein-disulfide reductase DsbD domain-containing protein [Candidatus Acidoferrum sp.]